MRIYEVKDICRMTGLTRREIFEYQKYIKPVAYKNAAKYKLFDDTALEQFRQVSIYLELDFSPSQIKELLINGELDKEESLLKQIELLKEKQKKIADMLYVSEHIYEMGLPYINVLSYISNDFSEMVDIIRKREERIIASDVMKRIEGVSESTERRIDQILHSILNLEKHSEDEYKSNIEALIEELETIFKRELGINKYMMNNIFSHYAIGGNIGHVFDEYFGKNAGETIGIAVTEYYAEKYFPILEKFFDLMCDVIEENGITEPEDDRVQKLAREMHENVIMCLDEFPAVEIITLASILEETCLGESNLKDELLAKYGNLGARNLLEIEQCERIAVDALLRYAKSAIEEENKEEHDEQD
ncbi:MAG: hypothetical protein Q4C46_07260 [Bacillota bacterium]|nr:hypothetical protein [Bacillota bacterium]